jgi:hypothetical protein
MTAARTTYQHARRGYDDAFEQALAAAIMEAIPQTSMVTDVNAVVFRTGETASALLTVLASVLAVSPAATRSPTQIRRTVDELGKRLRVRLAKVQPVAAEFRARVFTEDKVRGSA